MVTASHQLRDTTEDTLHHTGVFCSYGRGGFLRSFFYSVMKTQLHKLSSVPLRSSSIVTVRALCSCRSASPDVSWKEQTWTCWLWLVFKFGHHEMSQIQNGHVWCLFSVQTVWETGLLSGFSLFNVCEWIKLIRVQSLVCFSSSPLEPPDVPVTFPTALDLLHTCPAWV